MVGSAKAAEIGRRIARGAAASAAFAGLLAASAVAQEAELLGSFGSWSAYSVDNGNDPTCYIASEPAKAEGKYKKRGEVWALVSHRPKKQSISVVQLVAGYNFKEGEPVGVNIDGKKSFTLFTDKDSAWAEDGEDETLVKAMIRGRRMVVEGTSSRGTKTKDTYLLKGFTAAYRAISEACDVK